MFEDRIGGVINMWRWGRMGVPYSAPIMPTHLGQIQERDDLTACSLAVSGVMPEDLACI